MKTMLAAMNILSPPLHTVIPANNTRSFFPSKSNARRSQAGPVNPLRLRAAASASVDPDTTTTVDYSSKTSVFPAEACETVGGEACDVEMYPETKLKQGTGKKVEKSAPEEVERDYVDYNDPKTVFLEEACDDLGGEFCEPQ